MPLRRKENFKASPFIGPAFCKYKTPVVLCHLLYDGKANAGTRVFASAMQSLKNMENFPGILLLEA